MPRQKQNRMTVQCACGAMCSDTGSGQCRACFLKNAKRVVVLTELVKEVARLMHAQHLMQCRKLGIKQVEKVEAFYGSAQDLIAFKTHHPDEVWLPRHTRETIWQESFPGAPPCALDRVRCEGMNMMGGEDV